MRPLAVASLVVGFSLLAGSFGMREATAANFVSASYDARTDELVVTLSYRGTNPDHEFALQWAECRTFQGGQEIAARVLDSQWNDRALQPFTKTVRFGLKDLRCRPAHVILITEPNFRIGVSIPAAPSGRQ